MNDKYNSYNGRKRMESRDGGMISEDKSAIANLPQDEMMKAYPRISYDSYSLNDDIYGIDVQIKDDMKKAKRKYGEKYPEKY